MTRPLPSLRRAPARWLAGAGALLLAACASVPTQEMSDARQALRAARDAGAEVHAPRLLERAERFLRRAEDDLAARSYRAAREDALAAKDAALAARNAALALARAKAALAAAEQMGALSDEARDSLARAEAAAAAGEPRRAQALAEQAKLRAEEDVSRAQEARRAAEERRRRETAEARELLESLRLRQEEMDPGQRRRLVQAEAALDLGQVGRARELLTGLAEELGPPSPPREPGAEAPEAAPARGTAEGGAAAGAAAVTEAPAPRAAASPAEHVEQVEAREAPSGKAPEALAEGSAGAAAARRPGPQGGKAAVDRYRVRPGDHLWGIAARPEVYGDARRWPLLFKANRERIRDADLIHPGLELEVARDASPEEVAAALLFERLREGWQLGVVEPIDRAYLRGEFLQRVRERVRRSGGRILRERPAATLAGRGSGRPPSERGAAP